MNIWLLLGFTSMGFGWLLPNHQLPWTSFHSDAWVGLSLLLVSAGILIPKNEIQQVPRIAVVIAAMCVVPLVHLVVGEVLLAGTSWIGTLYLLGFLLAIVVGARHESDKPGELLDPFFFVIGVAAMLSVAIQFCQWLSVYDSCYCASTWIDMRPDNRRAPGNLGQPNQLATLLVWGIVAHAWGWQRGAIRAAFAFAGMTFLAVGLALTESRTGALCLVILVLSAWHWRALWRSRCAPFISAVILGWYFLAGLLVGFLSRAMLLESVGTVFQRTHLGNRLDIWSMFTDAAWKRPWFGYGWGQTMTAQVVPTTAIPGSLAGEGGLYSQAHNLFLDFVLWMGIPLGAIFSLACLVWLLCSIRKVSTAENSLLLMFVMVVGAHAMLELPLHYAYLLLPLGIVVGALDARQPVFRPLLVPRNFTLLLCMAVFVLYAFVVRDYFEAEESYSELRLEGNRIVSRVERKPPKVVVLTQIRDAIILSRMDVSKPLPPDRLAFVENVALTFPSTGYLIKMAQALSSNGQGEEAQKWLSRLCELLPEEQCKIEMSKWKKLQIKGRPGPQLVDWPETKAAKPG